MRFLLMHKLQESTAGAHPPGAELLARAEGLIAEMMRAGVLLATEGLLPSSTGARVRVSEGRRIVTGGPFTEAERVLAGFALVQVRSREEAIEWAARFADVIGEVEMEVRQVAGPRRAPEGR